MGSGSSWLAPAGERDQQNGEPVKEEKPVEADPDRLSGAHWWQKANDAGYFNSTDLADLSSSFEPKARAFVNALRGAGANVSMSTTLRSPERAWIMHWAWKIGVEGKDPPTDDPHGIGIIWDHGDPEATQAAALALKNKFRMKACASLTSRHLSGNAVDMSISWSGTLNIAKADGSMAAIGAPQNNWNKQLWEVGASYGVNKLSWDEPHWSDTGN